eukprot:scaffold7215_cov366-Prasinococcus_capsulatus_cf.AAC.4
MPPATERQAAREVDRSLECFSLARRLARMSAFDLRCTTRSTQESHVWKQKESVCLRMRIRHLLSIDRLY